MRVRCGKETCVGKYAQAFGVLWLDTAFRGGRVAVGA